MASTDRDVTYSNVGLVTPSQLESTVSLRRHNEMNHTTRVLLESQRLKPKEFLVFRQIYINQAVLASIRLEDVGIGLFANLTLELLPRIGYQVITFLFLLHFLLEPVL